MRKTDGVFQKIGGRLFRMGDDVQHEVRIAANQKVKSPIEIHSSLPPILNTGIFLSPQRGVMKVQLQETNLFYECPLNRGRSGVEGVSRAPRQFNSHLLRFRAAAFFAIPASTQADNSAAELNEM